MLSRLAEVISFGGTYYERAGDQIMAAREAMPDVLEWHSVLFRVPDGVRSRRVEREVTSCEPHPSLGRDRSRSRHSPMCRFIVTKSASCRGSS